MLAPPKITRPLLHEIIKVLFLLKGTQPSITVISKKFIYIYYIDLSSLYVCMAIKYIIVLFVETPRKFITAVINLRGVSTNTTIIYRFSLGTNYTGENSGLNNVLQRVYTIKSRNSSKQTSVHYLQYDRFDISFNYDLLSHL